MKIPTMGTVLSAQVDTPSPSGVWSMAFLDLSWSIKRYPPIGFPTGMMILSSTALVLLSLSTWSRRLFGFQLSNLSPAGDISFHPWTFLWCWLQLFTWCGSPLGQRSMGGNGLSSEEAWVSTADGSQQPRSWTLPSRSSLFLAFLNYHGSVRNKSLLGYYISQLWFITWLLTAILILYSGPFLFG